MRVYWKESGVSLKKRRYTSTHRLETFDAGGILPVEFYQTRGSNNSPLSAEQKLLLMMLIDAAETIGRGRGHETQSYSHTDYNKAVQWVSTEGSGTGPQFSFEDVCWHLGLAASATRKRILSGGTLEQLNKLRHKTITHERVSQHGRLVLKKAQRPKSSSPRNAQLTDHPNP